MMRMNIFLHILIIIYLIYITILSQAKNYVKTDFNKLSVDNLSNFAKEFLKAFSFSDNDRMVIDKATMAQHRNKTCMR